MDTRITITNDAYNRYGVGTTIKATTLFEDYCAIISEGERGWMWRIPFAYAIEHAAQSLGITFRHA